MLHLKSFRQRTHVAFCFGIKPLIANKRLMLMRLDSCLARRLLAEIQESANLIAEIRERTVVDCLLFIVPHRHRDYIVLRYFQK